MSISAYRLVKESSIPAFALDESNRIVAWSPLASDALGLTSRGMVGRSAGDFLDMRDVFGNRLCRHNCALHEMARHDEPIQGYTVTIGATSGQAVQSYASVSVIKNGRSRGHQIVFFLQPERRRQTMDALLERLLFRRLLVERPHSVAPNPAAVQASPEPISVQLSARQRQILKLIAEGQSTGQIAVALGVSVNTVRRHMQNILAKLECHSQAEAVAKGIRHALI